MARKANSRPIDPADRDRQILAALDLRSEFISLGVQFAKDFPRADGWLDCYAVARLRPDGREDSSPSAGCNIRTGRYHDFGGGGANVSFWDFAAAMGVAADWRAAREWYAAKVGVGLVGPARPLGAVSKSAVSGANHAKTPANTAREAGDHAAPAPPASPAPFRNGHPPRGAQAKPAARNPLDQLTFTPWTPAYERLAKLWCLKHKPGVTLEAIHAAGGRIAVYKKNDKAKPYSVLALPVWLAGDLSKPPMAYVIWSLNGHDLPVRVQDKETKEWRTEWIKMKTISPVSGGLIGLHGIQCIRAKPSSVRTVWKTEGPSDLLSLWSAIPSESRDVNPIITNAAGASEYVQDDVAKLLAGFSVNVVHDADGPGERGALKVDPSGRPTGWLPRLVSACSEVRHVRLPYEVEPKRGKDLRDYLKEPGNSFESLLSIANSTPAYSGAAAPDVQASNATASGNGNGQSDPPGTPPDSPSSDSAPLPDLSNGEFVEDGVKEDGSPKVKIVPLPMRSVLSSIFERTDNWPRRVNSTLFVDDNHHGVSWLETGGAFFGWLSSKCGLIHWFKTAGFVTKDETFQELRRTATAYASVEDLPHEPPIAGHYYTGKASFEPSSPTADPPAGTTISELVNRFCPETEADRQLILAMFATAFWGGKGGSRPAFVITSDAGRGAGKSKITDMLAYLAGGQIELSANEDAGGIRKRLLSPEGLTRRIARLDNVKSLKFSWAELESLITSQTISGHRMYQGEGSRPNTLTWVITLNGISLSTDMAQRSVIIKVSRPQHAGDWESETLAYIDANRKALISDLIWFLRDCPRQPLSKHSRWAAWESEVLSKLDDPAAIQKVLAARSSAADAETDEVEDVERFVEQQLAGLGYDTENDRIHIPSRVACEWYNAATNDKRSVVSACRIMAQFVNEGKANGLKINPSRKYGRGFIWSLDNISADDADTANYDLEDRVHRELETRRLLERTSYGSRSR